jgi:rubrerythrin
MKQQILAFICKVCPACNVARRWPNSSFAKRLAQAEKNCPACKAYKQVYGKGIQG